MSTLNSFVVANGTGGLDKFAFLLHALTDEVIEELEDKDQESIAAYMEQMGEIIAWIGHGDADRLPESIRPFADHLVPPELVEA
jgi:hypothetical protein